MAGEERRKRIIDELATATKPLSGSALARICGVSRQVIVADVALLRADGHDITSTNRGYVLATSTAPAAAPAPVVTNDSPTGHVRELKLHHAVEDTSDELLTIVRLGGRVLDVSVRHRVYGRIRVALNVTCERDVCRMVHDLETGKSSPLMMVTSGYHYHRIEADSEAALDQIERALDAKGYLVAFTPARHE